MKYIKFAGHHDRKGMITCAKSNEYNSAQQKINNDKRKKM
jgi:hypothetical protein